MYRAREEGSLLFLIMLIINAWHVYGNRWLVGENFPPIRLPLSLSVHAHAQPHVLVHSLFLFVWNENICLFLSDSLYIWFSHFFPSLVFSCHLTRSLIRCPAYSSLAKSRFIGIYRAVIVGCETRTDTSDNYICIYFQNEIETPWWSYSHSQILENYYSWKLGFHDSYFFRIQ